MPALAEQLHFPEDPDPTGEFEISGHEESLDAAETAEDEALPTAVDNTWNFERNHGASHFQYPLPLEGLPAPLHAPLPDAVRLGEEAHVEELRKSIGDN